MSGEVICIDCLHIGTAFERTKLWMFRKSVCRNCRSGRVVASDSETARFIIDAEESSYPSASRGIEELVLFPRPSSA
jgi:hypothetical protein